jgi:hypothetical protein
MTATAMAAVEATEITATEVIGFASAMTFTTAVTIVMIIGNNNSKIFQQQQQPELHQPLQQQ